MQTIYVRVGATVRVPYGSCNYFGSGCSRVRLTLSAGAVRAQGSDTEERNGFVAIYYCCVHLPAGSSAEVHEWHYPGGVHDRLYVADTARWREQRREHLIRLFADRASYRTEMLRRARRREELMAALASAEDAAVALYRDAMSTSAGRTGGRARRRAARARELAADGRRRAVALATIVGTEIAGQCNVGMHDLRRPRYQPWWQSWRGATLELLAGRPVAGWLLEERI